MKAMTFRLSDSDIELLKYISDGRGCSKADAIRFAIHSGADAIRDAETATATAGEGAATATAVDALTEQLRVKDEQIAALNRALDAAHETAKAAQVLHAQERKALESVEQKSRWRRLRDAWRG